MTSYSFDLPSDELLRKWDCGDPITDGELVCLERFFGSMVAGCEALGVRWSLATQAMRHEHDRATRTQGYRKIKY
jgi:hypothetical protein